MNIFRCLFLFIGLAFLGCAPKEIVSNKPTADVLSPALTTASANKGILTNVYHAYGANSYAPVSREWLSKTVYPEYVSQLARIGLWKDGRPRWTSTSQCNYFADKVVTVAQERLFNDRFNSFDSTESPAIGVIWYLKGAISGQGHAINVALMDDNSLTFFEPQGASYREVYLTSDEIKSIWFVKF